MVLHNQIERVSRDVRGDSLFYHFSSHFGVLRKNDLDSHEGAS